MFTRIHLTLNTAVFIEYFGDSTSKVRRLNCKTTKQQTLPLAHTVTRYVAVAVTQPASLPTLKPQGSFLVLAS